MDSLSLTSNLSFTEDFTTGSESNLNDNINISESVFNDNINSSSSNVDDNIKSSSTTAVGKHASSVKDLEFTALDQIDPMLDNIKIKARCISVWHSHPAGKPNQAYSFDIVLQDMKGNRIQCTARNNDMYRFVPLFQQGHCYMITDFSVGENNGILPLLNHKYKITFFQSTKVTRIDHFDEDVFGFKLEPFSEILSKRYHEKDSVDVVGAIVAIGDIIQVPNTLVKKVRRTVIIEDTEGTRVKCTFWDKWAEMFNQYVNNDAIGPVAFVLQLAKVKYFKDEPAIHNSLFGSRIFINKDIPAITEFKQRYTAKEGYSDGDHKIEVFTPPVVKITPEIFFRNTVKTTVGGIRALEAGTEVVLYGKVHRIHKEHGWCYDACKRCNKMAKLSKAIGSKKAYTCDEHGVIYQVVPRFKVILRVIDETGSAPFVVFDTNTSKICDGKSAYEIMNKHGQTTSDYFPDDLEVIVGKKYLFKFTYTQHNVNSNTQVYTAKSVSDDAELIAHFKDGFIDGQVSNLTRFLLTDMFPP
ncbi:replication protein A 70 kDa DNA-binding subunit B [Artemisia annua]|uniref:Replication protein A 70 kDa DNA-binding subunit B n=1 Tax=Artemisia annua TaxID=35608 RepID=A0A2U1PHP4_ARTAN|nr:replication protein A 70 kDa DNA-binding subunit B [Artemisia annua]